MRIAISQQQVVTCTMSCSRFLLALAGLCAFSPELIRAEPASVIPADHYRSWQEKFWQSQVDLKRPQPPDLIFIGDSITQFWPSTGRATWEKYYAARALNFGIAGDTTQNVLWRFEHLDLKAFHPKVGVILIGTNNYHDTPQDIATGVKAVIDKTRQTFPGIKIILNSILPNAREPAKMVAANDLIKAFADGRDVLFLDLATAFTPEGDSWKGLQPDKLHPDASGYEIWVAALNPVLAKFIPVEP